MSAPVHRIVRPRVFIILLMVMILLAALGMWGSSSAVAAGWNAPAVTSISPATGPTAGGTSVVIQGSNFTGATKVVFGTKSATYSVISSSRITATAPAGSGTVDVRVTTSKGTSAKSGRDRYTYVPAPSVTGVSPSSGPEAGGTSVSIQGSGFSGATQVVFGTKSATFRVVSSTRITATAPAGSGTVDVKVTTGSGTSSVNSGDRYTYAAAPTVTAVSPASGTTAGGTAVTIMGTNFTGATSVRFGWLPAKSFTVNSATRITAVSPFYLPDTVHVTVTTPGGTSVISEADKYTYRFPPTVLLVLPSFGPTTGGNTVVILGAGFNDATGVKFGSKAATVNKVYGDGLLVVTVPAAGSGRVDVTVTTPVGTSSKSLLTRYTYKTGVTAEPAITGIVPATGPLAGNTSVIITGTNLSGAKSVMFGTKAAKSFTVNSVTKITAVSPAGTGTVDVSVRTASGWSEDTPADDFTYTTGQTDIGDATIEAIPDQTYTGSANEPPLAVTLGTTPLAAGTDYTVAYADNTNVGTATVTLTGMGTYTGTASATFQITKATPEVTTWPTASAITLGQALSESTISVDGLASVAGTFAFTEQAFVPTATGTFSAAVTFTPTDAANYNSVAGSVEVTVNAATVHVTGVTLDKETDSIAEGGTDTLTATVAPADATNKTVTWSSDNTAVATVSPIGLVTAVAKGSATITVKTEDGNLTDTCLVTVTPPVWDGSVDVSWYNLTDTVFYISKPAQLAGLAAIVNGTYNTGATVVGNSSYIVQNIGGGTVKTNDAKTWIYGADNFAGKTVYLTADLDMGGVLSGGTWSGPLYMPVGGQYCMTTNDPMTLVGSSWNGTFDGQGHTVKNINCERLSTPTRDYSQSIGLIGRMGVHDNDPTSWWVSPAVRNVTVTGYVHGGRSVGGIVGKNGKSVASVIENCLNYAAVSDTDSKGVGGIAGAGWNNLTIRNCANFGSIYTSYSNAGGISGSNEATVINCYNVGYVGASSANQAQAMGTTSKSTSAWINCYWLAGSCASGYAVYPDGSATVTQMPTSGSMKTAEFLTALNGDYRGWVADTPAINGGYPIPRTYTTDTSTFTGISKTSDPTKLAYNVGQTFDATGLAIWGDYSDGSREKITDYTISKTTALAVTDTLITISGTYHSAAYGYDFPITVGVPVTGVTLDKEATTLTVGGPTEQLVATVAPTDATNKTVDWSSDHPEVATVSDVGLVAAVAPGSATITVKTIDGNFTDTCTVTVNPATIDLAGATIAPIGDRIYTGLAITPDPVVTVGSTILTTGTDYDVTYADNTNVGEATLTITGKGAYSGSKQVTFNIVKATPLVTKWPTAKNAITQGQSLSDAGLNDDGAAAVPGAFAYTVPGTIPPAGIYSADATFTPTDTANYETVPGKVDVTVNAAIVPVTGVGLNDNDESLAVSRTYQLVATVTPENATNRTVSWSSDNEAAATVSTSGLVTAVAVGTAHITVTTEDGPFSASCAITVTPELWDGSVDVSWYNTTDTVFHLSKAAQLAGLAAIVNGAATGVTQDSFSGKTIDLSGNITLDGDNLYTSQSLYFWDTNAAYAGYFDVPTITATHLWTPIGDTSSHAFKGTLDGASHTVSGLYTDVTATYRGLFGYVGQGATIKNVTISGVVAGKDHVGGIAGYADGATFTNDVNNAVIYASGGAVPYNVSTTARGISRDGYTGGIVGMGAGTSSAYPLTVTGCVNYGTVTCPNCNKGGRAGGIVGIFDLANDYGSISNCANTGAINTYQYAGGIVGGQFGNNVSISNCYNTGTIKGASSGKTYAGGIAGKMCGPTANCYNTGAIVSTATIGNVPGRFGGIIGEADSSSGAAPYNCTITNCYSIGEVGNNSGNPDMSLDVLNGGTSGNVVGWQNAAVTNCYYLSTSTLGANDATYTTGKSVAEMQDPAFAGLVSGPTDRAFTPKAGDYPVLRWQVADSSTLLSISITTPPAKTTYVAGDTFDPAGMVVTASYSDFTSEVVTTYTHAPTGALAVTDTKVTVSYGGQTVDQSITVSTPAVDIAGAEIAPIPDRPWTGSEITPDPVVTLGSTTLTKNVDYSVSYENNTNVGTATLTVTGMGGYTGTKSANFNIVPAVVHVTGVTLDKDSATLTVGDTLQLTATVAPADASNETVTWSSSDISIAMVDDTGLVTALAAGPATITVKTADGNKTASCAVTVIAAAPPLGPLSQQARLVASDKAASDNSGISVALSGDTAIVGAYNSDPGGTTGAGAAYVFTRSGGVWIQQAKLVASDKAADDNFGRSVALSGDTALVGAYQSDPGGTTDAGAAYVFTRSGEVWTQQAKLVASDKAASNYFGRSVALYGDTALIGATKASAGGTSYAGAAYVFTCSGSTWTQQQKLIAFDKAADDYFGQSVALYGDSALVGALQADPGGTMNAGAAYVFTRSGEFWTQQAKLVAPDTAASKYFGTSVALNGYTALIGANGASPDGINSGAAYVFTRFGSSWTQQAELAASDKAAADNFGVSVALSGDTALVGAFSAKGGGTIGAGAGYVFTRSGGVWTQHAALTASERAWSDYFGTSVALSSDTALIGASGTDPEGTNDAGATYVFGSSTTVPVTGVTLNKDTASLTAGDTLQLAATVAPENASDKSVTWSSSNEAVATVSTTGLVTAVTPGSATITVKTADGNFTSGCEVEVKAAAVTPAVTSLSPATGPTLGGNTVTINGTGFAGATSVTFGSAGAGTNLQVVSDSKITVTAPGSAEVADGTVVDITVTTPIGTSATSSADQYTYKLWAVNGQVLSSSNVRGNIFYDRPLAGATVKLVIHGGDPLYDAVNSANNVVGTATTDASGNYSISSASFKGAPLPIGTVVDVTVSCGEAYDSPMQWGTYDRPTVICDFGYFNFDDATGQVSATAHSDREIYLLESAPSPRIFEFLLPNYTTP